MIPPFLGLTISRRRAAQASGCVSSLRAPPHGGGGRFAARQVRFHSPTLATADAAALFGDGSLTFAYRHKKSRPQWSGFIFFLLNGFADKLAVFVIFLYSCGAEHIIDIKLMIFGFDLAVFIEGLITDAL